MPVYDFLGFFIIVALFVIGSLWQRDIKASQHQVGLKALVATLVVAELNTSSLLCFSAAGFFAGDWALALAFVFLISLNFYALSIAKQYRLFNNITHLFTKKYGILYAKFSVLCLIISVILLSAAYIRSFILLFSPLLTINPWLLSFIIVIFVVYTMLWDNYFYIIRLDILNFLIIIIFFPFILYCAYNFTESMGSPSLSLSSKQADLVPEFIISLVLLTSFSCILMPSYSQKIFSSKNAKVARWSVAIASIFVFALYSILIFSSHLLQKKGIELSLASNALPFILSNVVPIGARGIGYALIFCITATTLSAAYRSAILLSKNYLSKYNINIFLISITSYLVSNMFSGDIFLIIIIAHVFLLALSFALLAFFYWPRITRAGVYISTCVGLAWGLGCCIYYHEDYHLLSYWLFMTLPMIVGSAMITSLFSTKNYVSDL
jgi:Na+/proline symporter